MKVLPDEMYQTISGKAPETNKDQHLGVHQALYINISVTSKVLPRELYKAPSTL